jgi:hypothetical protein
MKWIQTLENRFYSFPCFLFSYLLSSFLLLVRSFAWLSFSLSLSLSLSLSPINFFIYLLKVVWSLCSKCLLVPEGGRVFWMSFSCFF